MIAETAVHDPERYRGAIYNAGTNEPRTVREVIELIFRSCDNEAALHEIIDAMKHAKTSGEISVQYMDFDVVERDFGWRPVTSFTDGISETIEWYRRYLTAVRE
jgi:nucleoside-diphosphate-sugar epimerase